MATGHRKYVVDTNLFIDSFHRGDGEQALEHFHKLLMPFVYLHAVVAHELRAGMRSSEERRTLEGDIFGRFERANRIVTPSAACWNSAGSVLAEMVRADGLELPQVSKSFLCDVLIALSCRESGVVLITANTRDFERIARRAPFKFVAPWPSLS